MCLLLVCTHTEWSGYFLKHIHHWRWFSFLFVIFAPDAHRRLKRILSTKRYIMCLKGAFGLSPSCPRGWQKLGPLHLFPWKHGSILCALQAIKKRLSWGNFPTVAFSSLQQRKSLLKEKNAPFSLTELCVFYNVHHDCVIYEVYLDSLSCRWGTW